MRVIEDNLQQPKQEYEIVCPHYPKDFFSYADGVSIKDDEINKWVKECVNDIDKDNDFSLRSSGDTIVFAFKSDEDVPAATVVVAKKYQEADVKISRKNF